jgi:hypothetical protein
LCCRRIGEVLCVSSVGEFQRKGQLIGSRLCSEEGREREREREIVLCRGVDEMIYDVNSALFRSFLSQKGAGEKRKMEEQKPSTQKPKANENKPVMNE